MAHSANICAGPFGALYDFYVERASLMSVIGKTVWGIDASGLYASMDAISGASHGATIIDVPCGGGVAFRALEPDQGVRYLAGDISPKMLTRARDRAAGRSLKQVELQIADMTALPYGDGEADLFLSYSGLHMIDYPERAVSEIGRCLKPGGKLVGTAFLAEGGWRHRTLFAMGARRGHALPPRYDDLCRWLAHAGIMDATVTPDHGFAVFTGRKRAAY